MKRIAILAGWLLTSGVASAQTGQERVPPPVEPSTEDDGGRVVGGVNAPAGSAKWQAEIIWKSDYTDATLAADKALPDGNRQKQYYASQAPWERVHSCGGALIAADWVLTAAHCLNIGRDKYLATRRVRIGTQNVLRGGATYAIDRVAYHAAYDDTHKVNDIALLHIVADAATVPVDPRRVEVIGILGDTPGDRPVTVGDEVAVTGWGMTSARQIGDTRLLRSGAVNVGNSQLQLLFPLKVFDRSRCASVSQYANRIWPTVLCVGSEQAGKDACTGDSGGPLTRAEGDKIKLVGVVSWGVGCALKGVPGIYTDATQYLDWIAQAKKAPVGQVTAVP